MWVYLFNAFTDKEFLLLGAKRIYFFYNIVLKNSLLLNYMSNLNIDM